MIWADIFTWNNSQSINPPPFYPLLFNFCLNHKKLENRKLFEVTDGGFKTILGAFKIWLKYWMSRMKEFWCFLCCLRIFSLLRSETRKCHFGLFDTLLNFRKPKKWSRLTLNIFPSSIEICLELILGANLVSSLHSFI